MAGEKFFALIDELDSSERRMDDMADELVPLIRETEAMAEKAVDDRRTTLLRAQDYIKRMRGVTERLAGPKEAAVGDNGGPTVAGLEGSLTSSSNVPVAAGVEPAPQPKAGDA